VDEVGREDATDLGGQELLPCRTRAAGRGVDPGVMQDLPDRRGRDRVAEPDEFACTRRRPYAGFSVAMRITSFFNSLGAVAFAERARTEPPPSISS
jgi:hypothetical protein